MHTITHPRREIMLVNKLYIFYVSGADNTVSIIIMTVIQEQMG